MTAVVCSGKELCYSERWSIAYLQMQIDEVGFLGETHINPVPNICRVIVQLPSLGRVAYHLRHGVIEFVPAGPEVHSQPSKTLHCQESAP